MRSGKRFCVPLWSLIFVLFLVCASCCPSGIWMDEFGNTYQISTALADRTDPNSRRLTFGSVDTAGFGCGIWTIRPLNPANEPLNPDFQVSWIAENPAPSPYTHCCDAFRFDGTETSALCLALQGQYQTFGSRCNQFGDMTIELRIAIPPLS